VILLRLLEYSTENNVVYFYDSYVSYICLFDLVSINEPPLTCVIHTGSTLGNMTFQKKSHRNQWEMDWNIVTEHSDRCE